MQKAPRLQMEVIFMSSPQLSTDSHSMLPFPFQVITVFLPPQFCLVSISHFLFLRPQDITISHLTGESDVGLLHKKVVCPQCTSFSQVGPSVRLKYFLQRTTRIIPLTCQAAETTGNLSTFLSIPSAWKEEESSRQNNNLTSSECFIGAFIPNCKLS